MEKNIILPQPHRILSIRHHTKLEHTFRVACDTEPGFGQFFMLSLPTIGEAPISASGKGTGYVEFTIRNVGLLTQALFDLEPGSSIFLRGPYGTQFPVRQFEHKDLIVVTGGTALSPVMTTLNHFYDHPEVCKSLHLIAGFKNEEGVLFRDELNRFSNRFNVTATLDSEEKEGFATGMVTAHIGKIPFDTFEDYNVVVVGPPIMMHFACLELAKHGVRDEQIWVSFERKMCCGVGKCGHCKINDTYVCLEGPVFNYSVAKGKLMD